MDHVCGNCIWWTRNPAISSLDAGPQENPFGRCRINAPLTGRDGEAIFAGTRDHEFCGAWKLNPLANKSDF
jgi:hypothetical protein